MTTKGNAGLVSTLRGEISELRKRLNELNEKKESFFSKRKEGFEKSSDLKKQVVSLKKERNELTDSVKKLKAERDNLNKIIGVNVAKLKELGAQRAELLKKMKFKENPSKIMEQISSLEYKIETEGLSFDKERKIMAQIKELKKKMGEMKGVSDVMQSLNSLSKETDLLKKQAEGIHNQIKEKAAQSQKKHEEMINASRQIDDAKPKEGDEENIVDIAKIKDEFKQVNEHLKAKLDELNRISVHAGAGRDNGFSKKESKNKKVIKEKQREVEEKIKKGQKLTTEDILAMQANK